MDHPVDNDRQGGRRRTGLIALGIILDPYPTLAEAIKGAGDAYLRSRQTPRVSRLFRQFLEWRR